MSPNRTLQSAGQPKAAAFALLLTAALMMLQAPAAWSSDSKPSQNLTATNSTENVSAFNLPRSLKDGRDPFYPSSTRVLAMIRPVEVKPSGPATLELKGISGTPDQPLAIINNRTMAVGESLDINTEQGRVRVMCLGIEGTKVKVRVQGEVRELMLRKGI